VFEPEALGQHKDELALALREARKQVGLTGNRLAARCGISQSKISKIETGKVLPSVADAGVRSGESGELPWRSPSGDSQAPGSAGRPLRPG